MFSRESVCVFFASSPVFFFTRCYNLGFSSVGWCVLLLWQRQRKQNNVINKRNIVFHFTHSCVISKQYNLGRTSSLNCFKKKKKKALGKMPTYAEAIANVIYKGFCWVFGNFFDSILPRQTKKFWNRLNILLPTYLAREFWRLIFIYIYNI